MNRDDDFIAQLEDYLDTYEGDVPLPARVRDQGERSHEARLVRSADLGTWPTGSRRHEPSELVVPGSRVRQQRHLVRRVELHQPADAPASGKEPPESLVGEDALDEILTQPWIRQPSFVFDRQVWKPLQESFGDLVFKTLIRKTVRYAEAPVQGSSVLRYDPEGPAAQAYRDLAKEVLNGAAPS